MFLAFLHYLTLPPRSNLDPWGEHTDLRLWEALQAVQLSAAVSQMAGGLAARMDQGGDNLSVCGGKGRGEGPTYETMQCRLPPLLLILSPVVPPSVAQVGQRQLFCLARALLQVRPMTCVNHMCV